MAALGRERCAVTTLPSQSLAQCRPGELLRQRNVQVEGRPSSKCVECVWLTQPSSLAQCVQSAFRIGRLTVAAAELAQSQRNADFRQTLRGRSEPEIRPLPVERFLP